MRSILTLSAAIVLASLTTQANGRPGYPACKDKAAMARVIELSDELDYQAAARLIQQGMKSKDCQFIPADQLVIETTPPLSRLVKVHRRGEPDSYWIIN